MDDTAVVVYIGITFSFIFVIVVLIFLYYSETSTFPWHSYITQGMGYFATFGIFFMMPMDIACTISDRYSTTSSLTPGGDARYNEDIRNMSIVYNVFFMSIQVLNSFVLLLEEYYNTDGYFTPIDRFINSLKRILLDNAPAIVVGIIACIVLFAQKIIVVNYDALMLVVVIVTNSMNQIIIMFVLGYALIEYPRSLWAASNLEDELLRLQVKASMLFKELLDAQLTISITVADVLVTKNELLSNPSSYQEQDLETQSSSFAALAKNVSDDSSRTYAVLLEAINILVSESPSEFKSNTMGKVAKENNKYITINSLANLRTKLNRDKELYKIIQSKLDEIKIRYYLLEDIVKAKNNPNMSTIYYSIYDEESDNKEYMWQIVYKPTLLKLSAVFAFVFSIFTLLGIICSIHNVPNEVSIYYLAVHGPNISPVFILFFVSVTFYYVASITTWGLFQIKMSSVSELVPGKTTPQAMSSNTRLVSKLAAPLVFSYLGWIGENGIRTGNYIYNNAPKSIIYVNSTDDLNYTYIDPITDLNSYTPLSYPLFSQENDNFSYLRGYNEENVSYLTKSNEMKLSIEQSKLLMEDLLLNNSKTNEDLRIFKNNEINSYVHSQFDSMNMKILEDSPTSFPTLSPTNSTNTTKVIVSNAIPMYTAFSNFYQLSNIPTFQQIFGTILPYFLFTVLFLVTFNIFNRLLVICGLESLQFGLQIVTEDQLKNGKRFLERYRRSSERKHKKKTLKTFISDASSAPEKISNGFLSYILGNFFTESIDPNKKTQEHDADIELVIKKPPFYERKVEKKENNNKFKDCYMVTLFPGYVYFFKDEKDYEKFKFQIFTSYKQFLLPTSPSDGPSLADFSNSYNHYNFSSSVLTPLIANNNMLDLRLILSLSVQNISSGTKSGPKNPFNQPGSSSSSYALDLDLGHELIRIKTFDQDEALLLKNLLLSWKEFHINYESLYGTSSNFKAMQISNEKDKKNKQEKDKKKGKFTVYDELNSLNFDDDFNAEDDLNLDDELAYQYSKSSIPPPSAPTASKFSSFLSNFTMKGKEEEEQQQQLLSTNIDVIQTMKQPALLEGWVLKKSGHSNMGKSNEWSKRYLKINKSGYLIYSKISDFNDEEIIRSYLASLNQSDKSKSKSKQESDISGIIDLKLVSDVSSYEKYHVVDWKRFNINIGNKVYKFQANSNEEGIKWVDCLNVWREYAILQGI